jgi:UDP-N-acetylglucosamine--N-acetylmuramyl-(pentapeptide) pyrophosphoryl-undecaprenol N-acetylglucosamine transferase
MRILITGGGTGGHIFPGIAVAKGMQNKFPDCQVMFIGTNRHIDQKAFASCNFQLASIECMGIKGKNIFNKLNSMLRLPGALLASLKIIKAFKPDLALGVGGYVTGPVLLAAKLQKIPVCIHEQNSVPGLANKIAAKIADKIFLSLPCNYNFFAQKTILTGNPVREEIIAAASDSKEKKDKKNILVLGGSQGAHRVNMLAQEAAILLKNSLGDTFQLTHQTGVTDMLSVQNTYRSAGIDAKVSAFFEDMALLYKNADLVVSRAGATTLAELSIMALPSILIPFPYAADNHQVHNGSYYVQNGGAKMFEEQKFSAVQLAHEISSLLRNPADLRTMSYAMKSAGKPEATNHIIDQCMQMIHADSKQQ